MDEKRVLLAVVLIFGLLFAYNMYVKQTAPPAPEPEFDAATEVVSEPAGEAAAGESAGDEPAGGVSLEKAAAGTEDAEGALEAESRGLSERLVTVETPLWSAVLSNRGGSILSWQLPEHEDLEGHLVDLVPEGENALDVVIHYGTSSVGTGDWLFEGGETSEIVLSEGSRPAVVRYAAERQGIRVVREYTFYPDGYAFDLVITVEGLGAPGGEGALALGWPGVVQTEKKEDNKAFASVMLKDGKPSRKDFGSLRKDPSERFLGEIGWATSQSRYFIAAVVPEEKPFDQVDVFADVDRRTVGFEARLPIQGGASTTRFTVFVGPQDYRLVSEMEVGLERAVDLGWSITRPLSVIMLRAVVWAHTIIPNYGVVIILFSILTKLLFYRLTHKSFTEMKRMQDLQPQQAELKEKHKDNKEALAKAQMDLYKREKVSPLGGCLPMLFQMPVFIALFQVLRTTIELRGAPFVLWITDLSQPDTIATIAGFPIHILPLLMGVGMLVQQRFSTKDPSQAMIGNMMPIVFTALFYNFASGLVLYWLVNTVLSVAQQYYIHRGPSTAGESSVDATTPGVQAGQTTASTTVAPEFEEAVVVETTRSSSSKKKRRGKRRKKR